jgi:hypothetical protein
MVPHETSKILAIFALVTPFFKKPLMTSSLPSSFYLPGPFGRPSLFPDALAPASPILVRSEIKSRSDSANKEKIVIMTFELMSFLFWALI